MIVQDHQRVQHFALVSVSQQLVSVFSKETAVWQARISTALNGTGCIKNSGCTPLGLHYIRAAIGAGLPENTVFKARRPTGEYWTPELHHAEPQRDWILTRILWLSGCESGINRGGSVDTFQRYIYFHGSPDSGITGVPASHGCIRLTMSDMMQLFKLLPYGSKVMIEA